MSRESRVESRESGGVRRLAEWLANRRPEAPSTLRAHMLALVDGHADFDALPLADALISAGESALARVLASTGAGNGGAGGAGNREPRETALDLLAADAFVTYAFEAAADAPGTVAERAENAMKRISKLLAAEHADHAD